MEKKCSCCGVVKSIENFQKRLASKDGLTASCKICLSARDAKKHEGNREHRLSLMRTYSKTDKAKKSHAISVTKWQKSSPEKRLANNAVLYALRSGKVTALPCFVCGAGKAEAHHPDYSSPLDVVWLCSTHHKQAHSIIRKAA